MELDLTLAQGEQPTTPLGFPLLSLLNVARNEHGLRTHDFTTYRHFCTTKVHRLRSGLKITHADEAHAPKAQSGAQHGKGRSNKNAGKGKKKPRQQPKEAHPNVFTRKTISVNGIADSRPLQLLLFEAERSWAFVQDLRTDEDHSSRQLASHARRALSWLRDLEALAGALAPRLDVRSRGQVAAYIANQRGSIAFDREDYPAALRKLSVARRIYTALANAAVDSKMEALDNAWIDASEAQIRFCAYSLELGEGTPDELAAAAAPPEICIEEAAGFDHIMAELVQLGAHQKSRTPLTLSWRGEAIAVRSPQLIEALGQVNAAELLLTDAVKTQHDTGANDTKQRKTVNHKRERLTSAQRTAKKRASGAGAGKINIGAPSSTSGAVASTSVSKSGGRTELDPYDQALGALSDAEALARSLVEDNAAALAKSHSARYEAVGADLRKAHEWLIFRLQSVRVRRNQHLIDEVVAKAAQRDKRATELLEKRLAGEPEGSKRKSRRSQKKPDERRRTKTAKPRRTGLPPKKPRSSPRVSKRRPAKSGTKRARRAREQAKEDRAREINAAQKHRRQARLIPGIAKLLDGSEASLQTAAGLNLVESHPDVSSLVDGKIAWYRAEIFRVLASAFSLSKSYDHALLLLSRASLSLRQARAAAELVDEHGEEDAGIPPLLINETFQKTETSIAQAQHANRKELFFVQHGLSGQREASRIGVQDNSKRKRALPEIKIGQVIRDVASKYISFEPTELDRAVQLDEATEAILQRELRTALSGAAESLDAASAGKRGKATGAGQKQQGGQQRKEVASSSDQAALDSAAQAELSGAGLDSYSAADDEAGEEQEEEEDEHFEDADDEEGDAHAPQSAEQKKGWLGGWFGGRK